MQDRGIEAAMARAAVKGWRKLSAAVLGEWHFACVKLCFCPSPLNNLLTPDALSSFLARILVVSSCFFG